MAVTREFDVTMATNLEFLFQYGCNPFDESPWPRNHSVIVQYSTNGGIVWNLLREIHYHDAGNFRYQ